jgi:hypothetical protein
MTTTITSIFSGKPENLKDALCTAIHYASRRRLAGHELTVRYICETDDYDAAMTATMDSIDIEQVANCRCELVSIG